MLEKFVTPAFRLAPAFVLQRECHDLFRQISESFYFVADKDVVRQISQNLNNRWEENCVLKKRCFFKLAC